LSSRIIFAIVSDILFPLLLLSGTAHAYLLNTSITVCIYDPCWVESMDACRPRSPATNRRIRVQWRVFAENFFSPEHVIPRLVVAFRRRFLFSRTFDRDIINAIIVYPYVSPIASDVAYQHFLYLVYHYLQRLHDCFERDYFLLDFFLSIFQKFFHMFVHGIGISFQLRYALNLTQSCVKIIGSQTQRYCVYNFLVIHSIDITNYSMFRAITKFINRHFGTNNIDRMTSRRRSLIYNNTSLAKFFDNWQDFIVVSIVTGSTRSVQQSQTIYQFVGIIPMHVIDLAV